jgi:hypothetical protein
MTMKLDDKGIIHKLKIVLKDCEIKVDAYHNRKMYQTKLCLDGGPGLKERMLDAKVVVIGGESVMKLEEAVQMHSMRED